MDSLLGVLLDASGSMTDGPQTDEFKAYMLLTYDEQIAYEQTHGAWLKAAERYSTKAKATVDAFNYFLQVMKYRRDTCDFYMAQFAGRERQNGLAGTYGPLGYNVTHNFVDLFAAQPLSQYQPRGGTAIRDAMMQAIAHMEEKITSLPKDERPTQVTLVVQTDGDDGSSLTAAHVLAAKMAELRKQRWNFLFLGTGVIAERMGHNMGFVDGRDLLMYEIADAKEEFEKAADAVLESLITGTLSTDDGGI